MVEAAAKAEAMAAASITQTVTETVTVAATTVATTTTTTAVAAAAHGWAFQDYTSVVDNVWGFAQLALPRIPKTWVTALAGAVTAWGMGMTGAVKSAWTALGTAVKAVVEKGKGAAESARNALRNYMARDSGAEAGMLEMEEGRAAEGRREEDGGASV